MSFWFLKPTSLAETFKINKIKFSDYFFIFFIFKYGDCEEGMTCLRNSLTIDRPRQGNPAFGAENPRERDCRTIILGFRVLAKAELAQFFHSATKLKP